MSQVIHCNDNPARPEEAQGAPSFLLAGRSRGVSRKSWRWDFCNNLADFGHQLVQTEILAGEGNPHLGRMTRFLRYVDKELGQRHCLAYFSPRDLTDVIAAVMHTVESVAR